MPRPEPKEITFTIDGLEVKATEGEMLVDAAKHGDVEIPIFCYEPKLGQPVGACRMCLVEVEGIPKLQTGCSTPVKDGMVVHTQTERVHDAQKAVVEFLLVNHPLDCPVCDKGGECPLQDITFGWGAGTSRFIEPKRHFRKPLEISPLIAIDRERCILCYRCVRYSQEIAEDYQLVLHDRGAHSFVGTFDGHPYVAPFSGNIIELCPVGALTSTAYRFRARPWDVETAGSVCTLCAAQCNVSLTVRDDKVSRVMVRDHPEVDDGWLCDKGRFAYQAFHVDERITEPLVREGDELRPASWDRAIATAAAGLARAGRHTAALVGGQATNEDGFLLQRFLREGLEAHDLDSRLGAQLPVELHRALAAPALQASVPDLEFAHAVLVLETELMDDAAILDLRIRKGIRRHNLKLAVASSRPSALDPAAEQVERFAPGGVGRFLYELASGDHALSDWLRDAGQDVVIVWGERMGGAPGGANALRALLNVAGNLNLGEHEGAGLLAIPAVTNGRGLREAGVLPNAGPGLKAPVADGRGAPEIAAALADGDLRALYLLGADPLVSYPGRGAWAKALDRATTVVAHAGVLTQGIREHADVVFPSEVYAEKNGTVVHPDGRVQRVRQAIAHVGNVRPEWQVIADVARAAGFDLGVLTSAMATKQLFAAVPFYAGLTAEGLAGHGVRWPAGDGAAKAPEGDLGPFTLEAPAPEPAPTHGQLRLGSWRSLWAAPEVRISPSLQFLHPGSSVELAPDDARRLGIEDGVPVEVAQNGTSLRGRATLRSAVPAGSVFVSDETAILTGALVEVRRA
ncbi:MAG TPA: NADH-quinone oxidoreductase subunit NuoG [Solirubrobacteraceae bacterium]|jgi:NADH-quinone oxidoreductase subunit G|nr:NADH-quinone oxidoreductase subunit NuoG [Solirubrobacteraceae bacterium]